jgi:hypothetical protein
MVRLMAIHFWTGDIRAVAQLVRERLGFHIDVPVESLKRVSDMFTKQVFPEDVLAMQVSGWVSVGEKGISHPQKIPCDHLTTVVSAQRAAE